MKHNERFHIVKVGEDEGEQVIMNSKYNISGTLCLNTDLKYAWFYKIVLRRFCRSLGLHIAAGTDGCLVIAPSRYPHSRMMFEDFLGLISDQLSFGKIYYIDKDNILWVYIRPKNEFFWHLRALKTNTAKRTKRSKKQ